MMRKDVFVRIVAGWFSKAIMMATLAFIPGSALATPILDQSQVVPSNEFFNGRSTLFEWQQQVTAGITGQLTSFDVFFTNSNSIPDDNVQFFINLGSGWQTDPDDFAQVITLTRGLDGFNVDVSASNIFLAAGSPFMIGIAGLYSGDGGITFGGSNTNPYSGGALYLNGGVFLDGGYDLRFRTYVEPADAAVPEPASWVLIGSGLAAAIARRNQRARRRGIDAIG